MAFHLRAALRAGDMNSLSRRTIVSLVTAVLLLLGLNLWIAPKVALRESPTSFGVERHGYKAAYDLLLELGVPVSRSYVLPGAIPADRSLWLVSPSFLNGDLLDDDAAGGARSAMGSRGRHRGRVRRSGKRLEKAKHRTRRRRQ